MSRSAPESTISLPFGLSVLRNLKFPHKFGLLDRIYGRALSRKGIDVFRTKHGISWKLDLRNQTHRWIVYDSIFGPAMAQWISNFLTDGGIVIDSGANIGQALVDFAYHADVRVYAFEPLPTCHDWILDGFRMNPGIQAELVPLGLYEESCELEIQLAGEDEIHGAHATLRTDWYREKNFKRLMIGLTTLDEFAEDRGIAKIRFWKLDVEGSELEALKGAKNLLASKRIEALLVETDANKSGAMRFLSKFGYQPYFLNSKARLSRWSPSLSSHSDYIFLPDS